MLAVATGFLDLLLTGSHLAGRATAPRPMSRFLAELVRRGRGERILIVTPRHVLEQMQHEMWSRFALPFVRLDSVGIQRVRRSVPASRNPFSVFHRAIISIDTLKSDRYLNHLRKQRWDAVVIDESHNFRNADYAEEKESRYQRLMRQVIREGVKTKVLMLSATPVNNRFNDLKNQLQLAYEGESENLAQHLSLSTTVEKVFSDAQRVFNEWSKLDTEHRTADRILQMLDFDFFELLDSVTIARSRKHIQAFYDTTEIGAFPKRRPPLSIREPLTDLPEVPGFNDIFEQLQALTLAVYTPLAYVFPSRRSKYEDLYNVTAGNARSNLGQAGREQGLKKLMTVNLLKRLESSVDAFRLTLAKIEDSVTRTLEWISGHAGNLADLSPELAGLDFDVDDEDDANIEGQNLQDRDYLINYDIH